MKAKLVISPVLMSMIGLLMTGLMLSCDDVNENSGMNNLSAAEESCVDGSAICRDDENPGLYSENGPYRTDRYTLTGVSPNGAVVHYPIDAEAPFASLVFCPGWLTDNISFQSWGPFMASHGFVMVLMDTTAITDTVDMRSNQQQRILDALKGENGKPNSPLYGKLDLSRISASGYSMGGGASWINASQYPGLRSIMTFAGHHLTAVDVDSKGRNINLPTLILNGGTDWTILGGFGQSNLVYGNIPAGVPKILCVISTVGHFAWGTPTGMKGSGVAELVLAFNKVFLEGDYRWAPYIQRPALAGTWETASLL